jgi:hypothetical protein
LLASDTNCRQETESLFAKAFKSLLQQNRHIASFAALQHSWSLLEQQRTLVDAGDEWLGR